MMQLRMCGSKRRSLVACEPQHQHPTVQIPMTMSANRVTNTAVLSPKSAPATPHDPGAVTRKTSEAMKPANARAKARHASMV